MTTAASTRAALLANGNRSDSRRASAIRRRGSSPRRRPAHRRPRSVPWARLAVAGAAIALLTTAVWLLTARTVALAQLPVISATRHVEMLAAGVGALVALWLLISGLAGAVAAVSARFPESALHRTAMTLAPTFTLRLYALAAGAGLALTSAGLVTGTQPPTLTQAAGAGPITLDSTREWRELSEPAGAVPLPTTSHDEVASGEVASGGALEPGTALTTTPAFGASVPVTAEPAQPATYIVQPGDSLWAIAAAHLGTGASDQEIAAEWPSWYTENITVIGADPDIIHPGMVLTIPVTS